MTVLDRDQSSDGRSQPLATSRIRPLPRAVALDVEDASASPSSAGDCNSPPVQPGALPDPRPTQPEPPPDTFATLVTGDSPEDTLQRRQNRGHDKKVSLATIKSSPPWMISGIFHMAVMIILALLMVKMQDENVRVFLDVRTLSMAEELGEQLEFNSPLAVDNVEEDQEPLVSLSNLPEVEDPFASLPMLDISPDGSLATTEVEAPQIGLALSGRQQGSRSALLRRYGGDATTEAAVDAGLEWLAKNQIKSGRAAGSWSLAGPFHNGVRPKYDNPVAATAMALLAFQGRGNTHKGGRFRKNLVSGWNWLLKQQDSDGNFFPERCQYLQRFYTQGQCAIALCELYGMTGDATYKEPAERAIQYCLRWQAPQGGWRYNPGSGSDLSVTGWILMALQSARMARLDVPEENLRRADAFLDSVAAAGGSRYCYEPGKMPSLAMTAEGLLCRQYLGWAHDDPRLVAGMEWITRPENLIDSSTNIRNVYYWYYATQAAHHMEGEYWERWNAVMRRELPQQQVKRGREMGSWDPNLPTRDRYAGDGGRLYVTCLSIYMLEVYYRHLPIYTKVYTGRNRQ